MRSVEAAAVNTDVRNGICLAVYLPHGLAGCPTGLYRSETQEVYKNIRILREEEQLDTIIKAIEAFLGYRKNEKQKTYPTHLPRAFKVHRSSRVRRCPLRTNSGVEAAAELRDNGIALVSGTWIVNLLSLIQLAQDLPLHRRFEAQLWAGQTYYSTPFPREPSGSSLYRVDRKLSRVITAARGLHPKVLLVCFVQFRSSRTSKVGCSVGVVCTTVHVENDRGSF